jgi:hypothetical protein
METIFKVGMKVWDDVIFPGQEGLVEKINEGSVLSIIVSFGDDRESYTPFGAFLGRTAPTLSVVPYEFKLPEQIVPHNFKKYDRVLVRDGESKKWLLTLYQQPGKNGCHVTLGNVLWLHCIPFDADIYENQ